MRVEEKKSDHWKTNNQKYGEHASNQNSSISNLKHKCAISTLDILKINDQSGYVHQLENIAKRQRHGLFTQPPGLSMGDQYIDKKPDECKKNIRVNPHLQQNIQPELFSRIRSTNIADIYQDPYKAKQLYLKEKVDLIPHGKPFLGTHNKKIIKHAEFQHIKEYEDKLYNTKDQNGKVITEKKNFSIGPLRRCDGALSLRHLFGSYQYIESPYNLDKDQKSNQRLKHQSKIIEPFVCGSYSKKSFKQDYILMKGLSASAQNKILNEPKLSPKYGPWKGTSPAKRGYNKTLERFPQYIEQGINQKYPTSQEALWIPNFNGTSKYYGQTLSRPCPVPSQMILNQIRGNRN